MHEDYGEEIKRSNAPSNQDEYLTCHATSSTEAARASSEHERANIGHGKETSAGDSQAGVSNSNCSVGHMRTHKVTCGAHYDADATIAVPELNFTPYFLRKVSRIIGKSFLAVSTFVLINSSRLRNLFTR